MKKSITALKMKQNKVKESKEKVKSRDAAKSKKAKK
jgi:hypothetical protein